MYKCSITVRFTIKYFVLYGDGYKTDSYTLTEESEIIFFMLFLYNLKRNTITSNNDFFSKSMSLSLASSN